MKKYEQATIKILPFSSQDIITMSVVGAYEGDVLPDGIISLDPWAL